MLQYTNHRQTQFTHVFELYHHASLMAKMGTRTGHNEDALVNMSTVIDVPNYPPVEMDDEGNALLPSNFLMAMVDKLPKDWFIQTYQYFRYFDRTQRDQNGKFTHCRVYKPPILRT